MYILKTNTAVRIAVGPLVDAIDGKTAKTSLNVTQMSVQLYRILNNGSGVTRTQFTPTASGGNNDMILVTSSTDGMYDLELTAAQLNFLGNARITFYSLTNFLVHWIDIQVVTADYFDWMFGTKIETVSNAITTIDTVVDTIALAVTTIDTVVDAIKVKTDGTNYGGALTWTYTITDATTGVAIPSVHVRLTSDAAGQVTLRTAYTNANGVATFYFDSSDSGTTVYVWSTKAGYNFALDTEVLS